MTTRYNIRHNYAYDTLDTDECDNGDWVTYDDHAAELATLRSENERLRGLVKDSLNLLDFLFEPGSYAPAVRLFCEKVKEELK